MTKQEKNRAPSALITGASRGIGAAAARVFAEAGYNVALIARSAGAIQDLAAELGAVAIPCDVADGAALRDAVAEVESRFFGLDVLVNNAAILDPIARLADADPTAWSRLIDINVKGVFHGTQAALPGMIARGSGSILTVSSGAAHTAYDGWSAYCASKAASAMLTASVHTEYHSAGIRALGLSPGTVATQMQRDIKASGIGPVAEMEWEDHVPPQWPARALLWMCSAQSDRYLGQDLRLRDPFVMQALGL